MPDKIYRQKNLNGSVILSVLSMATLSSVALFTMMFALRSMIKIMTLSDLQDTANQILVNETNQYTSDYFPGQVPNNHIKESVVTRNGDEYLYRQTPDTVHDFPWPLPGFSINSNYKTRLIHFKSQVENSRIRTPMLSTGWKCSGTAPGLIESEPQQRYLLSGSDPYYDNGSIEYDFNPETGQIYRTTPSGSGLLIDLDIESGQAFSRADFSTSGANEKLRFIIVFAITNADHNSQNHSNVLYILFDAFGFGQNNTRPIKTDQLANITGNDSMTGSESGYRLELDKGQLALSAITTLSGQVVFITQQPKITVDTGMKAYKNKLYQLDLTPKSGPIIQRRMLADSIQRLQFKIRLPDQNSIAIGTRADPRLVVFPAQCSGVFKYET